MKLRSKTLVMGSLLSASLIAVAALGAVLASAAGDPAAGTTVFISSGCGGCHTLADAGAKGKAGPNFDTTKPSFDAIVAAVTTPPSGMPKNSLTTQQIQDLAAYIVSVEGKQKGGGDTGGGSTGGHNSTSSTVRVTLKGWNIKISRNKVSAGDVTFKISNSGKGLHQFVIRRAPKNFKNPPRTPKKSKSPHAKSRVVRVNHLKRWGIWLKRCRNQKRGNHGLIGTMCKIDPGHKRVMHRKLQPGKYILVNRVPGYYSKGRAAILRVTVGKTEAPSAKPVADTLSPEAQAFVDAGCGGCHTLSDAGTTSTTATNLDTAKPSLNTVSDVVTNGMLLKFQTTSVANLDVMPAFNTKMSAEQIQSMASYVSRVTGGGDGGSQPPGRQNVLRMGCASCHTLADIGGTASNPGGSESYSNLNIAKPNFTTVKALVEAGAHDMPKYKATSNNPRVLNDTELADVETYISNVTGGSTQPNDGRQTFLVKGCSSCHTLADVGGVGERASSLDIGKPHYDTVYRILDHNMGTSSTTTPKRWGLTPGMPTRKTYSAGDKGAIATYISTVTGGASQDPASGRQLSLVGGCGNCHILAANNGMAKGTPVGPNLDDRKPSAAMTDLVLTNGLGPQPPTATTVGMPRYLSVPAWSGVDPTWGDVDLTDVDEKFSEAEIDLISAYIRDATGGPY